MLNDFTTIEIIIDRFSTQKECIEHLETLRWNGNAVSPFDATSKVYKCSNGYYQCKNTSKYFNVITNTLFHGTRIPLPKWFLAIYILETAGYHFSSVELAKQIGTTQKSAWYMIQRIKNCFGEENFNETNRFEYNHKRLLKTNKINLN
jgi:hypothetical protein